MKSGICRLCLNHSELAHSHVLPEFFYEPTYDETHRFISLSSHLRHKPKPFEKGIREYLLCQLCEGQLNRYETYAAPFFRKVDEHPVIGNLRAFGAVGSRAVEIPDFDYFLFKLFGLSLIWRCHVSNHHMFSEVNLRSHAERIRTMLVSENPGECTDYGFFLVKMEGASIVNTVIHAPSRVRFGDHTAYVFMAYGYEWLFVISSHSHNLPKEHPFVGAKRELVIPIEDFSERAFVKEMRRRMGAKLLEKDRHIT